MFLVKPEHIPAKAIPVPVGELMDVFKVCQKMELLCSKNAGIGLSAVQVGIPWKLFIARWTVKNKSGKDESGSYRFFIDCEYEPVGNVKFSAIEGCLSLRDAKGDLRRFLVERYDAVRVKGKELLYEKNLELTDIDLEITGMNAIVLQHEIDHHSSILISQIGREITIY